MLLLVGVSVYVDVEVEDACLQSEDAYTGVFLRQ